jgi:hypothetical protein
VRVYRRGITRPFVGLVHYVEYVQTNRDGSPIRMWAAMPRHMLAKCAEADAIRRGFPEETAGLYVDDELRAADDAPTVIDAPREPEPAPRPHVVTSPIDARPAGEEPLAEAVARWRAELFTARTVEDCDRVAGQIAKRRLAKGSPEHEAMVALYQSRRREFAAAARSSAPSSDGEPPREPAHEPEPIVEREPGSDDD